MVAYNIAQAKAKRLSMVEKLMEEMHDAGIKPHSRSFNILIGAAARTGNVVRALQVAEEDLPAAGLKQDTVTYNTVLFACAEARACVELSVALLDVSHAGQGQGWRAVRVAAHEGKADND